MLKNSMVNLFGNGINILIAIASIPLLIRYIGLENYGLWSLVVSVLAIVNLAEAGLTTACVVFISQKLNQEQTEDSNDAISTTLSVIGTYFLVIGCLAAGFVYFVVPVLVLKYFDIPPQTESSILSAFQCGAFYVLVRFSTQIFLGLEQAFKRYDILNILNSSQTFFLNVGLAAIAMSGFGLDFMAAWWAILGGIYFIVHFAVCARLLKHIRLRYALRYDVAKTIFSYSVFVWGGAVAQAVFSQFDRLVVGALLGSEKLGIYSALTGIVKNINVFSAAVVQPLLPEISEADLNNDTSFQMVQGKIELGLKLCAFLAVSAGGAMLFLAKPVLELVLNTQPQKEFIYSFVLLVVIYTTYSFNAVGYYILLSLKESKTVMLNLLFSVLVFLVLLITGTYSLGLPGSIMANTGYLITLGMLVLGLRKMNTSIKKSFNWIRVPIAWFVFTVFLSYLIIEYEVGLLLSCGIALLAGLILLFWFLHIGMMQAVLKLLASNKSDEYNVR